MNQLAIEFIDPPILMAHDSSRPIGHVAKVIDRGNEIEVELTRTRAEGDRLAGLCSDKAEFLGWDRKGAEDFIIGWLRRHGPLSSETLTDAAKQHGFRPHSDKAFGSIYSTLSRQKRIRSIGLTKRAKGHGSLGAHIFAAVL